MWRGNRNIGRDAIKVQRVWVPRRNWGKGTSLVTQHVHIDQIEINNPLVWNTPARHSSFGCRQVAQPSRIAA
jgi:hypothetical protein